ncbi:MAG TPA: amino acid adenylation domain-containing protein, partial [Gammaproteobacteria bacterium]|nr:amino acid adenylation domain-containing protein [Gammaproteobacteria bacterium]
MSSSLQDRLARLSPEKRALLAKKLASRAASGQGATATLPEVTPDPDNRFAPFPLTELQQAYWIGRSGVFELGSFAGHSYLEVENEFDLPRLNAAWQRLVTRHDMLRAVFREDGSQQVLETVEPYRFAVHDLRDRDEAAAREETDRLRHRISHQVLDSNRWPLFNIEAALLPGGRTRLFIGFDALIIDGWSMAVLFREWSELYRDPDAALAPLELSFRDYVLAERRLPESSAWKRSESYWKERIPDLPPAPVLPMARSPAEAEEGRFLRRQGRLDAASWSRIRELATGAGLTPTVIVLAAYAHVLGVWSNSTRFTLSIPQFNRFPLHPQANQIVGEAASFSLLEVDLGQGDSFTERARMIQQRLWEDLDHTYYNGVSVLRELARRNPDGNTLMPVVFTGSPQDPDGNDGYATNVARALGDVVYAINQTPQVWLDNHISEQDGELVCDWDTVEELFPEGMQDAMFDAFLSLLRRLASDETTWQASWPEMARSLVPAEQLARRQAMNARVFDIPDLCLQELLVESAARHPDKPAVITSARTLSYAQLLSLASRWAHRLRELGVRPGTLTAVVMEKGWEQAVAAYAVLFAGGAYAPMDPDQPAERLNTLIEDSQAGIILTQQRLDASFDWPAGPRRLCVDGDAADACPDEIPDTLQTPDDLAYVIYTSGSTGRPKGVMLAHRGVVNALLYTNETFGIGADDIGLGVAALHHDLSIYDLFGLLAAGGTLVLPDARDRRDPAHWSALLVKHQVTVWNSVPAMMNMLLEYAGDRRDAVPASLRYAFLGGDWIPLNIPDRLRALAPQAQVISTGGPTETTLWNIWYPVESVDPAWRSIPYGRPIANARYYILNEALQPCPDWVAGEMCCAGTGVAKGYWQDADKTAEKFIDHPGLGEH